MKAACEACVAERGVSMSVVFRPWRKERRSSGSRSDRFGKCWTLYGCGIRVGEVARSWKVPSGGGNFAVADLAERFGIGLRNPVRISSAEAAAKRSGHRARNVSAGGMRGETVRWKRCVAMRFTAGGSVRTC